MDAAKGIGKGTERAAARAARGSVALLGASLAITGLKGCLSPGGAGGSGGRDAPRRGLFGLSTSRPSATGAAGSTGSTGEGGKGGAFDAADDEKDEGAGRSERRLASRSRPPLPSAVGADASGGSTRGTDAQGHSRSLPYSFGPDARGQGARGDAALARSGRLVRVEGPTWRTTLGATRVFSAVGRALSQTYVVARVDRRNFTIQTDWDKFFIDGRLFRNRMVVSVFPVGARQTEVVIRNSLEYAAGPVGAPGPSGAAEGGAWLPSPDITDEVQRLVDAVNAQLLGASAARRNLR